MGDLTSKMSLFTWDAPIDPYDYQQLSNNWQIVDFHDHSPGRGVPISRGGIAAGAVGPAQLGPDVPWVPATGILGLRGAAGTFGRTYYATDVDQLFFDNSSIWRAYGLMDAVVVRGNATATAGQMVIIGGTNVTPLTVTLPPPAVSAVVGITPTGSCGVSGAAPVTVAANGGTIHTAGANGASSIKLGALDSGIVLISDGFNWFTFSGQQNTGWVGLTLAAGVTANGLLAFAPQVLLQGGLVRLRGGVLNTSGGTITTIGTLPTAFRPPGLVQVPVAQSVAASPAVVIQANGTIASTSLQNNEALYLDGITYTLTVA